MTGTVGDMALPPYPHIPGRNARHRDDFFDAAKQLAPAQTRDQDAADNLAWLYGLRLIKQHYYWEAHEILETVWLRAAPNSRERKLVQGMIHLANGALKIDMGRADAARRLRKMAEEQFKEAFAGMDNPVVMQMHQHDLQRVAQGNAPLGSL